jgi:uncharacterized membrane protein
MEAHIFVSKNTGIGGFVGGFFMAVFSLLFLAYGEAMLSFVFCILAVACFLVARRGHKWNEYLEWRAEHERDERAFRAAALPLRERAAVVDAMARRRWGEIEPGVFTEDEGVFKEP